MAALSRAYDGDHAGQCRAARTCRSADRMGVIETDQPLAVRSMQRHGILEAVRLVRPSLYSPDTKVNPVLACRIDDERLAVQIQQCIQSRIPPRVIRLNGYQCEITQSN